MENNPTYLFVVAAALRDPNGRILVQMRPEGKSMAGLWEFPGGKVESPESPEDALVRELKEELGIVVNPAELSPIAFASEPLGSRHLLLLLYICEHWSGFPRDLESNEIQWLSVTKLRDLKMPPADIPLVEQLVKILT